MRKLKVFCVPDIHAPFHDVRSIGHIYASIEKEKPDVIIQLGDILDRLCFSRFGRMVDEMTPKEEMDEGYAFCQNFWAHIQKLAPKARKIQLRGNHETRLLRSTIDRFPEVYSIVQSYEDRFFKFPGVECIMDSRSELEIEGVIYTHGWYTKIGDHCKFLLKPVVHGHSHRGGTFFINVGGSTIWELDCGFLADQNKSALQYGSTKTTHWTLGYGIVDRDGPRFVSIADLEGGRRGGAKRR